MPTSSNKNLKRPNDANVPIFLKCENNFNSFNNNKNK